MLPYLNLPYFGEILQGIAGEALKHGYHVQLFQTNYDRGAELEAFHRLKMKEVDGLILTSRSNPIDVLTPYIGPDVVMCENIHEPMCKKVFINHYKGIRDGVDYLHSKGHTRIGLCLHRTFGTNSEERIRGFHDSLESASESARSEWIFNECYDLQDGRNVVRTWAQLKERPTAIIATSDQVASGIIAEAGKEG